MSLLSQFRDLDDPDGFVRLRGFSDMASRGQRLAAFYGGPVWARHPEEANATTIDSDNVLLLRTPTTQAALNLPARNPRAEAEGGAAAFRHRSPSMCSPLRRGFASPWIQPSGSRTGTRRPRRHQS
jgi:hypothetical protein